MRRRELVAEDPRRAELPLRSSAHHLLCELDRVDVAPAGVCPAEVVVVLGVVVPGRDLRLAQRGRHHDDVVAATGKERLEHVLAQRKVGVAEPHSVERVDHASSRATVVRGRSSTGRFYRFRLILNANHVDAGERVGLARLRTKDRVDLPANFSWASARPLPCSRIASTSQRWLSRRPGRIRHPSCRGDQLRRRARCLPWTCAHGVSDPSRRCYSARCRRCARCGGGWHVVGLGSRAAHRAGRAAGRYPTDLPADHERRFVG